ncbi:MAG: hypothetical protein ACYCTL_12695 [Acidimicrobiales bacterium]
MRHRRHRKLITAAAAIGVAAVVGGGALVLTSGSHHHTYPTIAQVLGEHAAAIAAAKRVVEAVPPATLLAETTAKFAANHCATVPAPRRGATIHAYYGATKWDNEVGTTIGNGYGGVPVGMGYRDAEGGYVGLGIVGYVAGGKFVGVGWTDPHRLGGGGSLATAKSLDAAMALPGTMCWFSGAS